MPQPLFSRRLWGGLCIHSAETWGWSKNMNRIEKILVIIIGGIFLILAGVTFLVKPEILLLVLGMEGVLIVLLTAMVSIFRNTK
jgi:hypothetical protein